VSEDNLKDNREKVTKSSGILSSGYTSSPNNKEYNSIPSSRFYTEKEEVTLRFYQTLKALFKNPKYIGLSLGSKLMYSILRDRLDLSIKNNRKDENGFIYLVFSIEKLATLSEINKETVINYKRKLVRYRLIIYKRLGQGKSNMIYVLKPEIRESLNTENPYSRVRKNTLLEYGKSDSNDTNVNETNLNNINRVSREEVVENSEGKIKEYPGPKRYRPREKEELAREIAEELEDDHSLGAFRTTVDKISEQQIRIFLSIVKDTYLTGKIKKSRGAMFISLARAYAVKNSINLNFK